MSSPAARRVRAVPSVATRWKPSPANAAATGTAAALSASRTDRNTVPSNGSERPAARSAFAKAVGRSAALAMTSPVARISGPRTGSAPGNRANGSTAALTLTCFGGRSAGRARSRRRAPAAIRHAASTRFTPIAFEANGTVRDARGFTSSTKTSWSATASCTFSSPTTPRAGPSRRTISRDLGGRVRGE